jgi:hypothetical protein
MSLVANFFDAGNYIIFIFIALSLFRTLLRLFRAMCGEFSLTGEVGEMFGVEIQLSAQSA